MQAADQIKKLYELFLKVDATQVEVNPFGETPQGQGEKEQLCFPNPRDLYPCRTERYRKLDYFVIA